MDNIPVAQINSPKISSRVIYLLILVVVILLAFGGGFFVGKNNSLSSLRTQNTQSINQDKNPLITSEPTTAIPGKVTKVNGRKLTITNSSDVTGELDLAEGATIITVTGNAPNLPTSDIKAIELNRDATIIVKIEKGKYLVSSVIYQPPPLPPSATQSGTLSTPKP